mmetsp:Transcript_22443/g.44819  ORF Transcript_22443/g.44819 Transcript_22443/m.44819 type:complete len:251 (-) Transcript_22443:442-1194(-)
MLCLRRCHVLLHCCTGRRSAEGQGRACRSLRRPPLHLGPREPDLSTRLRRSWRASGSGPVAIRPSVFCGTSKCPYPCPCPCPCLHPNHPPLCRCCGRLYGPSRLRRHHRNQRAFWVDLGTVHPDSRRSFPPFSDAWPPSSTAERLQGLGISSESSGGRHCGPHHPRSAGEAVCRASPESRSSRASESAQGRGSASATRSGRGGTQTWSCGRRVESGAGRALLCNGIRRRRSRYRGAGGPSSVSASAPGEI